MSRKNPIANFGQATYIGDMEFEDSSENTRQQLEMLIRGNGDGFAAISLMLGKNPAYIQQFIKRGTPKKLDEEDRRKLAEYFGVTEQKLGGPVPNNPVGISSDDGLVRIKQLQISASAGPGSLSDDDFGQGEIAFQPKWLKQVGSDPSQLSMIAVDGDSMDPTLCDGDDIMVDHSAARKPLREGIHVLRMDDVLLVKRVALRPAGRLAIRSDNPQYPDWDDVDAKDVNIIGRVVWTGRRL